MWAQACSWGQLKTCVMCKGPSGWPHFGKNVSMMDKWACLTTFHGLMARIPSCMLCSVGYTRKELLPLLCYLDTLSMRYSDQLNCAAAARFKDCDGAHGPLHIS